MKEKVVQYEYDVDEALNGCAVGKPSSSVAVRGLVTPPKALQVLRQDRALHRSWTILVLCLSLRKLRHIGSFKPVLGKGVSIFHVPANKLVVMSVLFEVGSEVEMCSAQCSSC